MNKRGKDNSYDYLVKMLIIGDSGVGKTNILLRACDNKFSPTYVTTIGIDFKIKIIEVDDKKIKMQIWDTAGQDRFKTITQTYYKGAMGILMTYSINDLNSFNNIKNWMAQIREHAAENVCVMLVGNKCDTNDRRVDASQGKNLADSYGIPFMETSAKDSIGIEECFRTIGKEIKDKVLVNDDIMVDANPNFRIGQDTTPSPQEQGGCRC